MHCSLQVTGRVLYDEGPSMLQEEQHRSIYAPFRHRVRVSHSENPEQLLSIKSLAYKGLRDFQQAFNQDISKSAETGG